MLHAKPRAPSALAPATLLDVQLSALIYLLARCARRPCDGASAQLALDHLGMLAGNVEAGALLRQTAARLVDQWRRRPDAGDPAEVERAQAGEANAAGAACAPCEPGALVH